MEMEKLANGSRVGIRMVFVDKGPGIPDIEQAMTDGFSTGKALGQGLPGTKRLMDECEIRSNCDSPGLLSGDRCRKPVGTVITARKWLEDKSAPGHFVYSVNSRPCPGSPDNGDGYFVAEDPDGLLLAVVDGLGHSHEAAKASGKAVEYLSLNRKKDLAPLLAGLHGALRNTRGAAVTLVRVCLAGRKLLHAGVGNVETRIYPRSKSCLLPKPGIIGVGKLPGIKVSTIPWTGDSTLVIYTDGISGRWDLRETPELLQEHVTYLCHSIFHDYARPHDDATIVVAREVLI